MMMQQVESQSPSQWYQQALTQGFVDDPAQHQAVAALQMSYEAIEQGRYAQGCVYLWGPVGRGKTWLMDRFFDHLPVPAKRLHFHHFMQQLHRRLHQLTGTAQPLAVIAVELAAEIKVLCFDEFFVSDIADAMLLGPLFQALFAQGMAVVMTSNQAPEQLYGDGFNREQFLPTIAAIEREMWVVAVDGEQDHRLHPAAECQRYWVKQADQPSVLPELFQQLSADEQARHEGTLEVNGRKIKVRAVAQQVLWCDFAELCEQPLSANDYIELCQRFKAILLGQVPDLSGPQRAAKIARGTEDAVVQVVAGDRHLPNLARHDDSVRRFIALIDECYEGKVSAYIEADVAMDALYTEGYLSFAFRRTYSRLRAMQRHDFV